VQPQLPPQPQRESEATPNAAARSEAVFRSDSPRLEASFRPATRSIEPVATPTPTVTGATSRRTVTATTEPNSSVMPIETTARPGLIGPIGYDAVK
jgi:hypothetical protein